nr:hypothetical protein [Bradyrhizobium sp. Ec3.3]
MVEIATSIGPVQGGRIHIEKINAPFLYTLKASGEEFGAGIKHARALNRWKPSPEVPPHRKRTKAHRLVR